MTLYGKIKLPLNATAIQGLFVVMLTIRWK